MHSHQLHQSGSAPAASAFVYGVLHLQKSKVMGNGYINLDLDCWHTSPKGKGHHQSIGAIISMIGVILVAFQCYLLTGWYYLNEHGEGKKVDFPMKIKAVIGWSPKKHFFDGNKLVTGSRFPIERLSVYFARLPSNEKNLLVKGADIANLYIGSQSLLLPSLN